MKNNIIILGKGFLGKKFEQKGFEVLGKDEFYIKQEDSEQAKKEQLSILNNYNIVINCIGKSNTRWCERRENFNEALFSNGIVPGILSKHCKAKGIRFVHISTGCLYDDNKSPQKEDGFKVAHCNYVVTKWAGEQGCSDENLILRPRLYFGDFKDKNNLLCKLPHFKKFLIELNSYTSIDVIVDATIKLFENEQSGIFNVACEGYATIIDLARLIGLDGEEITGQQLKESEKLYLVNNIMNLSKLKRFYQPPRLETEVIRCWEKIKY